MSDRNESAGGKERDCYFGHPLAFSHVSTKRGPRDLLISRRQLTRASLIFRMPFPHSTLSRHVFAGNLRSLVREKNRREDPPFARFFFPSFPSYFSLRDTLFLGNLQTRCATHASESGRRVLVTDRENSPVGAATRSKELSHAGRARRKRKEHTYRTDDFPTGILTERK